MFFQNKTGKSVSRLKKQMASLIESVNSWILLLRQDQADLKVRVYELERKIRILESEGLIRVQR